MVKIKLFTQIGLSHWFKRLSPAALKAHSTIGVPWVSSCTQLWGLPVWAMRCSAPVKHTPAPSCYLASPCSLTFSLLYSSRWTLESLWQLLNKQKLTGILIGIVLKIRDYLGRIVVLQFWVLPFKIMVGLFTSSSLSPGPFKFNDSHAGPQRLV